MLRVQPATPTSLSTSVLRHRPPSFTEASLSTPLKPIRAPPSPSVAATAQAALKAERSVGILKRALLAVRSTPLLNVSARGSGGATRSDALSDLQLAFAAGPITGDRLPLPRRPQPPPTPKPAFVPQATPSFIPLPPTLRPPLNALLRPPVDPLFRPPLSSILRRADSDRGVSLPFPYLLLEAPAASSSGVRWSSSVQGADLDHVHHSHLDYDKHDEPRIESRSVKAVEDAYERRSASVGRGGEPGVDV